MAVKPLKYVKPTNAKAPAAYVAPVNDVVYNAPAAYVSKYGNQLDSALSNVTNFNYDPMKDASYQALAKVYGKRGEVAAKNTMGDAAMLNGGLGTSYATSAAQQMRNDYNMELASLIPDLEEKAYNRNVQTLAALREADESDYGRYRDTVGDAQWKYGVDYQAYRDKVGDSQWKYSQEYQKWRDQTADAQWARNFNLDVYGLKQQEKKGSGGGGGRGGRGGGGGGYAGGGGSTGGNPYDVAANVTKGVLTSTKAKVKSVTKLTNKQNKQAIKKSGGKYKKGKTDSKLTSKKGTAVRK